MNKENAVNRFYRRLFGLAFWCIIVFWVSFVVIGLIERTEAAFFSSNYITMLRIQVMAGWVTLAFAFCLFIYLVKALREEYEE